MAATACVGPELTTTELTVDGMVCDSCSQAISHQLEKLDGVEKAQVSYREGEAGLAIVDHDVKRVAPEALIDAINGLGYHAQPRVILERSEPGGK